MTWHITVWTNSKAISDISDFRPVFFSMAKPEAMVQLGDLVKVTTHTGWSARQEWYVREVK